MMLPKFAYREPETIQAASALLASVSDARILSGGTDLLVNMKNGFVTPSAVINLKRIPGLNAIRFDKDGLNIGPLATLKSLYTNPELTAKLPGLAAAAASVGSYHHQVMGTVGGNLCQENRCFFLNQSHWWRSSRPACLKTGGDICHVVKNSTSCFACYHGDLAPVLMVLEAEVHLTGGCGVRSCLVEKLFSGQGQIPLTLQPGEIVSGITIPGKSMTGRCGYHKLSDRGSIDFPIIGAAFWASGEDRTYRICLTAVDRKPVRAEHAEAFLAGRDLDEGVIRQAAALAAKAAHPVSNTAYSPAYKKLVLQQALARVMRQVMGGPQS